MARQAYLPLGGLLYECMNPECFFVGSLLPMEDVLWKDFWNSSIEDMDVRPICPSCLEPMAHWENDEDGLSQTFV